MSAEQPTREEMALRVADLFRDPQTLTCAEAVLSVLQDAKNPLQALMALRIARHLVFRSQLASSLKLTDGLDLLERAIDSGLKEAFQIATEVPPS